MSQNLSNFLETSLLGHTFLGSVFTPVDTLYLSLATSIASDGDFFTEVTTNIGYARQPLTRAAVLTGITSVPQHTIANSQDISFPTATATWGNVVGVGIHDIDTIGAGNLYFWGLVSVPRQINSGGEIVVPAGDMKIKMDTD